MGEVPISPRSHKKSRKQVIVQMDNDMLNSKIIKDQSIAQRIATGEGGTGGETTTSNPSEDDNNNTSKSSSTSRSGRRAAQMANQRLKEKEEKATKSLEKSSNNISTSPSFAALS